MVQLSHDSNVYFFREYFYFRATNFEPFTFEFFKTFQPQIWTIHLLLLFLLSSALSIIFKYEYKRAMPATSVITCFGIYCQQGVHFKISSISMRCLTLFLLVSSLIIYNFYTSGIVSFLIENKYETDIKTKEDLAESSSSISFSNSIVIKSLITVTQLIQFKKKNPFNHSFINFSQQRIRS